MQATVKATDLRMVLVIMLLMAIAEADVETSLECERRMMAHLRERGCVCFGTGEPALLYF